LGFLVGDLRQTGRLATGKGREQQHRGKKKKEGGREWAWASCGVSGQRMIHPGIQQGGKKFRVGGRKEDAKEKGESPAFPFSTERREDRKEGNGGKREKSKSVGLFRGSEEKKGRRKRVALWYAGCVAVRAIGLFVLEWAEEEI